VFESFRDMASNSVPAIAAEAVLVPCDTVPDTPTVQGYNFDEGVDYQKLFESFATTGFQATNFAKAVKEVNRMACAYTVVISDSL